MENTTTPQEASVSQTQTPTTEAVVESVTPIEVNAETTTTTETVEPTEDRSAYNCVACRGEGIVANVICSACSGTGKV